MYIHHCKMKRIPILIGFLLLLLVSSIASPAQISKTDSLMSLLDNSKQNKSQANILVELTLIYYKLKNDSALYYAKESLNYSQRIDYTKGIGESYLLLGRINRGKNKMNDAIIFYEQAEKNFIKIEAKDRLASVYNNLGLIKKNQGNFRRASHYYNLSVENYKEVGDKFGEAAALSNLGVIYFRTGNYEKATKYYIDALKIRERINDNSGIATTLANLGNLSLEQKDYNKALEYFDNAKSKFLELNNQLKVAMTLFGIGEIYVQKKDNSKALLSYQEALKYFKRSDNKNMIAAIYGTIGELYYGTENYKRALENQLLSLQYCLELDDKLGAALAYSDIGLLQIKLGLFKKAKINFSNALSLAKTIGSKQAILDSYQGFSLYYKSQKEFKTSLEYLERHAALKDSLFSIETSKEISRIQTQYETEKKEQENEILRQEQKANTAIINQQNLQNKVQFGALILFFALAAYFFSVYKEKQRSNEQIAQKNQEITESKAELQSTHDNLKDSQLKLRTVNDKLQVLNTSLSSTVKERTKELEAINYELDTFLYQSSHALRRPMVSAMGLTRLAKMKEVGEEVNIIYERMEETLVKMDFMLKKLVTASEISFLDLLYSEVAFPKVIKDIKVSLKEVIKNSTAKVKYKISKDVKLHTDQRLLTIILENLIENSIAFQKVNGTKPIILTTIENTEDMVKITVHDNGIGIPPMVMDTVFDMFIVGTGQSQGYGLGLYLVNKATKKINGTISVRSELDKFSTFEILLPKQLTI